MTPAVDAHRNAAGNSSSRRSSAGRGSQSKMTAPARKGKQDTLAAWILITPLLVLFAISVVYPVIETVRLSFYDIRGLAKPKFFGFENYFLLATDPNFRQALLTTLQWTLVSTLFSVGIGWLLAMLCSLAPSKTLPFRVMIFAAYGVSEAVSGFMWLGIYRPDAGMLNAILEAIGLSNLAHPWLGDTSTAIWAVIAAYVWTQVGLPLMLCFASIQSIPKSLLEAAHIDGATPTRMMRYIIMPLSMPGVRVAIFINLLQSLKAFDLIFMLTGGGPIRSTETVGYFMYRESMQNFKLGYGAASTVVLLLAVLLVSIPAIMKRTGSVK